MRKIRIKKKKEEKGDHKVLDRKWWSGTSKETSKTKDGQCLCLKNELTLWGAEKFFLGMLSGRDCPDPGGAGDYLGQWSQSGGPDTWEDINFTM